MTAELPPTDSSAAGPPRGHAHAASPAAVIARAPDAAVLDARDAEAFARGHLAGAGRIAPDEFRARRAELPPRTTPVTVVHDDPAEARRAASTLALLGYRDVVWLDAPLAALPGGHADTGPAARLWRPSPFLERVTPLLPPGRALDFASGAGRDAVHLALHGWRAEAWDHDPDALARARALADSAGVAVATRVIELVAAPLPEIAAPWDVIVVVRFLHRPLLPWLERALAPGGALVYETFRDGQQLHGRPKQARYLLQPGELARAFPSLVVEHYEEAEPAGGPVLARVLARRGR